jgi:medium-chain acyl-[acyl-carrier-protein] hydrolase
MRTIKLFCLPYAGASAVVYSKWKRFFNERISLHPIELSGRGRRIRAPFYENMEHAVDDIYDLIKNEIEGNEFAFFGHSMGTLLAYELCHKIKQLKGVEPIHIFFSGRYPPHIVKKDKTLHVLSDKEFTEEIFRLGGTPKEVYESKEILNFFIPVLKADYKIIEKYEYSERANKMGCSFTCLTGKYDKDVKLNEMLEWGKHTEKCSQVHEFEGGHFFINEYTKEITEIINGILVKKVT